MKNHVFLRNLLCCVLIPAAAIIFWCGNVSYASDTGPAKGDFYFIQVSDTHVGFNNPAINPDWQGTLKKAIAKINSLNPQPDFVVFTGELTHTTDNPQERRKHMKEFREIVTDNVSDPTSSIGDVQLM